MIELKDVLTPVLYALGIVLLWWRTRVEANRRASQIEAKAQTLIQAQFTTQQKQIADLQAKLDKAEADLATTRQEAALDRQKAESEIARLTVLISAQTEQLNEYKREREALSKELAKKSEREQTLSDELNNSRGLIREQGTRLAQMEGAAQVYEKLLAVAYKPPSALSPVEAPAN